MTTPGPAAQASTTVNAQDVRVFSLGLQAGEVEAHAVVPGLGNVTATSVTVPPSASQQMLVVVKGLGLTTGTPEILASSALMRAQRWLSGRSAAPALAKTVRMSLSGVAAMSSRKMRCAAAGLPTSTARRIWTT